VINAATKGPQAPSGAAQPDEKFLNFLVPILTTVLPSIIDAATKGYGGTQPDEKFLNFLVPILSAVVPAVINAATR
jgi:hypothetical protein